MESAEAQPHAVVDVFQGAIADLTESERKFTLLATTGAALATLAVNGAKIPLVAAPSLALEALQYTDSSTVTGLVTGAVFGAWTYGASGIVNAAGNHYPEAKAKAKERYPRTVDAIVDSLPGLKDEVIEEERGRISRFGRSIITHAKRGVSVVGIGASVYVAGAQLEEMPTKEIHRMRRRAAVDSALVIGSLSCATAGVVAKISDSHPELAHHIQDGATDTKTLFAVALSLIVGQGLNKWRKKRKTAVE
jgi:hypothetical protein